ncbi:plasmid replication protein RepC (plasmid) [Bradyrhizobium betae]
MQELAQIALSPFGSRPLSPDALRMNSLVRDCEAGTPAHKWKVFRDISAARAELGVPDRALVVLNALLSFHPDAVLTAGSPDLVVFPSNRRLSLRAHGMAASTLRRHLAALVDHGLILRRDSPNGKRFARKSADGAIELAYGFDLGPIVARAREFERLAERIEEQLRLARHLRQRLTVLRRDVVKMIAAGVAARIPIDWAAIHLTYRGIAGRVPRAPTAVTLELLVAELQALADHVLSLLNSHLSPSARQVSDDADDDVAAKDEAALSPKAPSILALPDIASERTSRSDHIPLRVVLDGCPDIADYARGEIRTYRDLLIAAAVVRPLLGISPSAWEEAGNVMGEAQASAVVAAILQRGSAIKNPGGYLRNLTRRAASGQFTIWPMLMALSAARLKRSSEAG